VLLLVNNQNLRHVPFALTRSVRTVAIVATSPV
jgi:hypothetical protein